MGVIDYLKSVVGKRDKQAHGEEEDPEVSSAVVTKPEPTPTPQATPVPTATPDESLGGMLKSIREMKAKETATPGATSMKPHKGLTIHVAMGDDSHEEEEMKPRMGMKKSPRMGQTARS